MNEKERLKAALDQVHAEASLKSSARHYLFEKIYSKKQTRRFPLRRLAAAGIGSILLLSCAGAWLFFSPAIFISVDINPSLELGINRFDRIVSVTGYNEDGKSLAKELQIKYMDYTDALEALMADQDMKAYLSGNADVVLTVAGKDSDKSQEVLESVESCMSAHQNVHCHSGDSKEFRQAHDAGLSLGKYQAWQVLRDLDPDITQEDVTAMTMSEIRDLISEYSQKRDTDSSQEKEAENLQENQDTQKNSEAGQETAPESSTADTDHHDHHRRQEHRHSEENEDHEPLQ